jgi:catechol 2,3-dioxygenase-like lactoylglutathione lyase family enzyme
MKPKFRPGRNIAMKLPERSYAATLAFYRDTLGFPVVEDRIDGALIDFGSIRLHLDRVPQQSQTDLWLEILTDDCASAAAALQTAGVARCDEVEALPVGFDGFWISAPSGTIHLVANKQGTKQGGTDG